MQALLSQQMQQHRPPSLMIGPDAAPISGVRSTLAKRWGLATLLQGRSACGAAQKEGRNASSNNSIISP